MTESINSVRDDYSEDDAVKEPDVIVKIKDGRVHAWEVTWTG